MAKKSVIVKEEDIGVVDVYQFSAKCPYCNWTNDIEHPHYEPDSHPCERCDKVFGIKYSHKSLKNKTNHGR